MLVHQFLCDFCGRPFRFHERCRDQSKEVTVIGMSRTKEWDTRELFPHLCEGCATKLDIALKACKDGMATRELIMARNAELNTERREKLGTKG